MKIPSSRELNNALKRFEILLGKPSSEEEDFQKLFKECPYILSCALPLKIEPSEIHSLGRPGISEPDFIFYPKNMTPVPSFGVIELKKPKTKLITSPRKDLIILSRDAATALAQAQNYSKKLKREMSSFFRTSLIIGNKNYIFVIAGLTEELTAKSGNLFLELDELVPPGCQIIPYDTLFKRFASSFKPITMVLKPMNKSITKSLKELVDLIIKGKKYNMDLNDDNMAFWIQIENEWRKGNFIGTKYIGSEYSKRIIDRKYWCIIGTNILATESPNNYIFENHVQTLINKIKKSAEMHEILDNINNNGLGLNQLKRLLSSKQSNILAEAVDRCKRKGFKATYLYPLNEDVEFLEKLGVVRLINVDSGELYFSLDPLVFEIFKE